MATRESQIIINVDDKSLRQLNEEISRLEDSIDGLVVGTEEWIQKNKKLGDLKRQLSDATGQAEKLQGQVEKISSAQQLQSIAKLGTGLVGAFSVFQGTANLIGINNEQFEKMTAVATNLTAIMGGLTAVADLFSKETIDGIKGVITGFGKMTKAVQAASNAQKAALISTGVGALIVAVGVLIAYWEELTNLFDRSRSKFEKQNEVSEKLVESLESQNDALEENIRLLELAAEYGKVRSDAENSVSEAIEVSNKALVEQLENEERRIKLLEHEKKKAEELLLAEEDGRVVRDALNFALTQNTVLVRVWASERQKAAAEDFKTTSVELETAKQTKKNLEEELRLNKELLDIDRRIQIQLQGSDIDYANKLNNKEAELIIAQSIFENDKEIFDINEDILELQIEQLTLYRDELLKAGGAFKLEDQRRLVLLEAQLEALRNQNDQYEIEEERIRLTTEYGEISLDLKKKEFNELTAINNVYTSIIGDLIELQGLYETNSEFHQVDIENLKQQRDLVERRNELLLEYDKKNRKSFQERKELIEAEAENYIQIVEATNKKLENDRNSLLVQQEILKNERNQIEEKIKASEKTKEVLENEIKLANELLELAQNEEERLEIQNQLFDLNSQMVEVENENNELIQEQNEKLIEQQQNEAEILQITDEINYNHEDINLKIKETNKLVDEQGERYKKLQNFVEDFNEEILATSDAIFSSLELFASLQDNRAEIARRNIEDINSELNDLEERLADTQSLREKYEEELKDANGERYNELQRLIAVTEVEEKRVDKEKNLRNEELAQQQDDLLEAERNAAKWRKAQAIIDATIATALAVIKALPNVILSVAVGIAGAAGIATIAAQPLPEPPDDDKYEGGFTRRSSNDRDAVGAVHANEYVVPAKVVRSPSAQGHIRALEKQRKGYQTGGPVTAGADTGMDYEKFTQMLVTAISALPPSQVSLVAVSNGIRDVELTKQDSGFNR